MVAHKHLHIARRKLCHMIDEIYTALLHYGSKDVNFHISRTDDGLTLLVKGDFSPTHLEDVLRMGTLLQPPVRNPAMVEEYWELAGGDQYSSESELALVGHMSDGVDFTLNETQVEIKLFVMFERA